MVLGHQADYESQRTTIKSIASKMDCSAETLRSWVRQRERDQGSRPGQRTSEAENTPSSAARTNWQYPHHQSWKKGIIRKGKGQISQLDSDYRASNKTGAVHLDNWTTNFNF